MRLLKRNAREIQYALYIGQEDIVSGEDEYGNPIFSGETEKKYSEKRALQANIGPPDGTTTADVFGGNVTYDRVLVTFDMDCPIDENSILWIDKDPETAPYDYNVAAVRPSLNCIRYAIKRVNVS